MHYLLFYEVVDNYAEKRVPFRKDQIFYVSCSCGLREPFSL